MENYLQSIHASAVGIIKEKEGYDFDIYLKSADPCASKSRLSANIKYVKKIFDSYEQLMENIDDFSKDDEFTGVKIIILKKFLVGDDKTDGLLKNLGMFFSHWDFVKEKLDRKKVAEYLEICVNLMARDVKIKKNDNLDISIWDEDTQKYFELGYIQNLILEEIKKYK